nr:protein FRA10AC1-like isoform X2 [Aegilops tauschii subsp. strangulata]
MQDWIEMENRKGSDIWQRIRYFLFRINTKSLAMVRICSFAGQFICGNRRCDEKHGLGSYEVNFSYVEAGEQKQALVQLVACKRCAEKLAYKRLKEKEKEKEGDPYGEKEIELKDRDKRKREHEGSDDTSEDEAKKDRRKKKGTADWIRLLYWSCTLLGWGSGV